MKVFVGMLRPKLRALVAESGDVSPGF